MEDSMIQKCGGALFEEDGRCDAALVLDDEERAMLSQFEADKLNDLTLAKAQVLRSAVKLVLMGAFVIVVVVVLCINSVIDIHGAHYALNGFIAGGASYITPSLTMKEKIENYYQMEEERMWDAMSQ